jgi:hypothetical protein
LGWEPVRASSLAAPGRKKTDYHANLRKMGRGKNVRVVRIEEEIVLKGQD